MGWRSGQAEDTTRTQQEHLLLAQLAPPLQEGGIITFDPNGPPRCPPPAVMAELQQMSNELKLGSILRKRRDPGASAHADVGEGEHV